MGETEKKRKTLIKYKKLILVLILSVLLLFFPFCEILVSAGVIKTSPVQGLFTLFNTNADEKSEESIYFLSVGQGDCTVIKSGDVTVLIDFGLKDDGNSLYWQLKELRVDRVDLALATHSHKDHIGGFCDLAERMKIDNLIISDSVAEDVDGECYDEVLKMCRDENINIYIPKENDIYTAGDIKLEILYVGSSLSEENNRSVISAVTFKNKRFLFLGDSESENELDFLKKQGDLSADVVKLAHHGSNTSTSYEFLDRVNPRVAIASSGYNNSYSHPNEKVLQRLNEYGVDIYRTDLDGTVKITVENNFLKVVAERESQ